VPLETAAVTAAAGTSCQCSASTTASTYNSVTIAENQNKSLQILNKACLAPYMFLYFCYTKVKVTANGN